MSKVTPRRELIINMGKNDEIDKANKNIPLIDGIKDRIDADYIRSVMLIVDEKHFEPSLIFECGQCFRWKNFETEKGNVFIGIVGDSILFLQKKMVENNSSEDDKKYQIEIDIFGTDISNEKLIHYFDLETDYETELRLMTESDEVLKKAACFGLGIRLLKQDIGETFISFIISANNNIPKIRISIESLCKKFGKPLGKILVGESWQTIYSFPSLNKIANLSLEELSEIRAIGYRADYIYNSSKMAISENLESNTYETFDEAIKDLKRYKGIGTKVASCIALFGFGMKDAFPVDTWIKKMLEALYGVTAKYEKYVSEHFRHSPGLAQQYLFYYMRYVTDK